MKKNEKGFGTVGVLIVVVAVALLAFVGWIVWQSSHKNKSTNITVQAKSHIVISQWAVDVMLRDADKLEYVYFPAQNGSLYGSSYDSSITFLLKSDQIISAKCGRLVGVLLRSIAEPKVQDVNGQPSVGSVKKLGNYYYFEPGASSSCGIDAEYDALIARVKQDMVEIQSSK